MSNTTTNLMISRWVLTDFSGNPLMQPEIMSGWTATIDQNRTRFNGQSVNREMPYVIEGNIGAGGSFKMGIPQGLSLPDFRAKFNIGSNAIIKFTSSQDLIVNNTRSQAWLAYGVTLGTEDIDNSSVDNATEYTITFTATNMIPTTP